MTNNNSLTHFPKITDSETNAFTSIISRVFRIDDTTWGTPKQRYLVRYRGSLLVDSEIAYEQLLKAFKTYDITPLFRIMGGKHTIILKRGIIQPKPTKTWVNILLLLLTMLSMLYVGTIYTLGGIYEGHSPPDISSLLPYIKQSLGGGIAFTVSFLAILLAHEFGHYFVAKHHKTAVSLPYFLPFPNLLGTLGAVILTKEIPRNKKVLLDIGIAGPLAGFIVTIPVLIYGIKTSELHPLPAILPGGMGFEGNSVLYLALKFLVHGKWLPEPATFDNLPPFIFWIRYFFTGKPFPTGGIDMTMNSVALAGWAGLLVTGLNLIPFGQLDGGHLIYGILGKRTEKIMPFIIGSLLILGVAWTGWWLWAVLLLLFNRRHGETLDEITPLNTKRKLLAILGLILFFLVFTPVPMTNPSGL